MGVGQVGGQRRRGAASPLRASGWSTASFAISQAVGSLLYLPLARLLTPEDFGLITEAGLVSAAVILLGEASLVQALIRMPGDRAKLAHATLWLSVATGLIGVVVCALAGLPLAAIYDDERLRLILLLVSPSVLFSTLGAVPYALLARELDFRRRTLPETVSIGVGGLAALVAALLGAGVYSLVIYTVTRTGLGAAVAWWVVGWRPPRGRPDGATMRGLLTFGLPAAGGDLALYTRLNADYAITGRRLGSDPLGVYTLAWTAAAGPALLINAAFGGVGFATYSRLQNHSERLRAVYLSATRLIATLALPLFFGAVFVRQELVDVLYGEKWQGMVGPLLPLFLLQGIREVCRPGAGLTLATGHNRLYALCGVAMVPLTVTAVLIGTRGGIVGVSWAMLIAVGGASLVWPSIAVAVLRPSRAELWRTAAVPLLLAGVTGPAVGLTRWLLAEASAPAVVHLAAAMLAGGAVFLLAAWLCWGSLRQDVQRLQEALPEDAPPEPTPAEVVVVVPVDAALPQVDVAVAPP